MGLVLPLVISWALRLSFCIDLWMLCLNLVTITLGEGGDAKVGLLVDGIVVGSWVDGWVVREGVV